MQISRRRVLAASVVPAAALASLAVGALPASAAPAPARAAPTATRHRRTAAVSASASASMLRPGSRGAAVLAAQKRLAALGYWLGTPDGVYGPATAHAVTALQKVAGLARDGILGPRTAKVLKAGVRPRAAAARATSSRSTCATRCCSSCTTGPSGWCSTRRTGSGAYYQSGGSTHHAVTPAGHLPRLPRGQRLGPRAAGRPLPAAVLQRRHRRPRLPLGAHRPRVPRLRAGHPRRDGLPVGAQASCRSGARSSCADACRGERSLRAGRPRGIRPGGRPARILVEDGAMSNLGPLAGGRAQGVPTPPRGDTIARYATYLEAQRAVDYLSDNAFPVQAVTIVGTGLRMVERVTGRLTYSIVALRSLLSGAYFGAMVGLILSLFTTAGGSAILAGALFGAGFSVIFGLIAYSLTGGRRDFSSVSQVVATEYEVLCLPEQMAAGPRAPRAAAQPGRPGAERARSEAGYPPPSASAAVRHAARSLRAAAHLPAVRRHAAAAARVLAGAAHGAGGGRAGPARARGAARPAAGERPDLRRDDREAAPGAPRARGRRAQAARPSRRAPRASRRRTAEPPRRRQPAHRASMPASSAIRVAGDVAGGRRRRSSPTARRRARPASPPTPRAPAA